MTVSIVAVSEYSSHAFRAEFSEVQYLSTGQMAVSTVSWIFKQCT